jgi:caa(3)-type oxidase subunit IV
MAQGKKDGGKASQKGQAGGSEKKAKAAEETSATSSAKKATDAVEAKAASSHDDEHADHGHSHAAAAGHAHDAHGHAPNRKEYFYVFLVLFVLTILEVGVAKLPGVSRTLIGLALVGLAVTKAATVALYYMHLKHETRVLRLTIAIPMATPAVYALVLITEGAWRLAR